MREWVSAIAIVAVLAACMMGPDYKRPETAASDSWRVHPATTESIANMAWWDLLKDPSFNIDPHCVGGKSGSANGRCERRSVSAAIGHHPLGPRSIAGL
jgi:hypothetical protein